MDNEVLILTLENKFNNKIIEIIKFLFYNLNQNNLPIDSFFGIYILDGENQTATKKFFLPML